MQHRICFKRWVAFGLLSSHSRLHGNESYRVPWDFDEEACRVLKAFVELKCTLMPYLFAQACRTHESGLPMMRAMVLEFPSDPVCAYLDSSTCLVEPLVAPIFQDDGKAVYYLPKGRWTHLLSNKEVEGGSYQEEVYDYFAFRSLQDQTRLFPLETTHNNPITRTTTR